VKALERNPRAQPGGSSLGQRSRAASSCAEHDPAVTLPPSSPAPAPPERPGRPLAWARGA
jgi:hypothetical protein